MTSGSPAHPSALQTVGEGGKVNLFRDRRIHSDALDAITILTSP